MSLKVLGPVTGSGVLILLLGSLTGGTMAAAAPTFSGYHWPAGAHLTYQVTLAGTVNVDVTAPTKVKTTATIGWDPTATLTTGQSTANGTPITIRFSKAPLQVTTTGSGHAAKTEAVSIGSLSLTGMMQSDGRLTKTHFTMPKTSLPSGVNLSSMLPIQGADFMPPVPKVGWTAGRGFLFSQSLNQSALAGLGALGGSTGSSKVALSNAKLGEWIVPQVGHHHWSVTVVENMMHPTVAAFTLPFGKVKLTLKEALTGAMASHYTLNGQQGGLLESEQGGGHLSIIQSGKVSTGSSGSPVSYQSTTGVKIHFAITPLS